MKKTVIGVACLFFLTSCSENKNLNLSDAEKRTGPEMVQPHVIYGEDNRLDLYQVQNNALLALADSTVALVEKSKLSKTTNGRYRLNGQSLANSIGVCPTERFANQLSGAFCSGFLISQDTIVTAGHCIRDVDSCNDTAFVFGFGIKSKNKKYNEFPANDLVGCKSIVHSQVEGEGADFAIIKLTRPIYHHRPLKIRTQNEVSVQEGVFVIGHPSGLPTKVSGGAVVRENSSPGYFVTNLDTYGGNSGSAVFNLNTFEVEGILVRGEDDYVFSGSCRVSNRCASESCRGEDVTRISAILPYLQ